MDPEQRPPKSGGRDACTVCKVSVCFESVLPKEFVFQYGSYQ